MIGFWKYDTGKPFLSAVIEDVKIDSTTGDVRSSTAKGYGTLSFPLSHLFEHDDQGKQAQESLHQIVEDRDAAVDKAEGLFKEKVDAWKSKYSFFEIDNQHKRIAQIIKEKEDGCNK